MRELNLQEVVIVAGGNDSGSTSGGSGNLADHPCNPGTEGLMDSVVGGALGGAIGGAAGGVVGAVVGAIGGAVVGAVSAAVDDASDIETCLAEQESQ